MIDEAGLDAALDLFLGDVDRTVPYTVWVDECSSGTPAVKEYTVDTRRPDGSVLTILSGIPLADALRVGKRVKDAIEDREEWIFRLVDVSAGKLRG